MLEPDERRRLSDRLEQAGRRLLRQGLIERVPGALSLRLPGSSTLLLCSGTDGHIEQASWAAATAGAPAVAGAATVAGAAIAAPAVAGASVLALHAAIYRARSDVGAIAIGGGRFGRALAGFGGRLPRVFDEQARHLGVMPAPLTDVSNEARVQAALAQGGNAVLIAGVPVCTGMTCQRLLFNAELFEKCAAAWLLAIATGGKTRPLPWWVRRIADGRLRRDERRAARRFRSGALPEEVEGY